MFRAHLRINYLVVLRCFDGAAAEEEEEENEEEEEVDEMNGKGNKEERA